jgi:hypothetical protein
MRVIMSDGQVQLGAGGGRILAPSGNVGIDPACCCGPANPCTCSGSQPHCVVSGMQACWSTCYPNVNYYWQYKDGVWTSVPSFYTDGVYCQWGWSGNSASGLTLTYFKSPKTWSLTIDGNSGGKINFGFVDGLPAEAVVCRNGVLTGSIFVTADPYHGGSGCTCGAMVTFG